MIVAEKKKRENIAEYVIYMWQLEDMARAQNFEASALYQFILGEAVIDPEVSQRALNWYQELCDNVKSLRDGEHVPDVHEVLQELNLLHGMLLTTIKDEEYSDQFEKARAAIEELKERGGRKNIGDVEACFNGMYGIFLLDIQKKEVSEATREAIAPIRELLRTLSQRYAQMKSGTLNFSLN